MKRFLPHVLAAAALVAAMFVAGCGSSDTATLALTPIDNSSQGAAAASAGLQAQDFALIGASGALSGPGAGDWGITPTGKSAFRPAGDPRVQLAREKVQALAARVRELGAVRSVMAPLSAGPGGPLVVVADNGTMTGPGGGYFTWRRSYDSSTGVFSIELAFFGFKDNGYALQIVNGTLSESGKLPNPADNTHLTETLAVRLGTSAAQPLTIESYTDNTFSVLENRVSYYLVANLDAALTRYPGPPDNVSEAFNVSVPAGTLKLVQGPGGTGDNVLVAYNGYGVNVAVRNYGDNTSSASVSANGGFQFAVKGPSADASFSLTYTNMRWTDRSTANVSSDGTIDGVTSFAFTPVLHCTDNVTSWTYGGGTYAFATALPIHYDVAQGHTTAGQFSINGTTVVTFNADGSVTVTVKGVPIQFLVSPDTVCTIDLAA